MELMVRKEKEKAIYIYVESLLRERERDKENKRKEDFSSSMEVINDLHVIFSLFCNILNHNSTS